MVIFSLKVSGLFLGELKINLYNLIVYMGYIVTKKNKSVITYLKQNLNAETSFNPNSMRFFVHELKTTSPSKNNFHSLTNVP
jgi:hypothetical protein